MIRFILNAQLCEIDGVAPDLTVLEYLRTNKMQRGTKEGCSSGDCGACTLVVAEPSEVAGRLHYRAINGCITFLGALHGKQLITSEGLVQADGGLHPVQRAMVNHHGSQCGFCTPGIVMSLFAMGKNAVEQFDPTADAHARRHLIDQSLGGNLCRCTGYRPIIDAAAELLAEPEADQWTDSEAEIYRQLQQIRQQGAGAMALDDTRFFSPTSLAELIDQLREYPEARLLAGGTDLALEVTQQLNSLSCVIYTGSVREMCELTQSAESLCIGGAVRYSEATQLLAQRFPEFASMLTRLGSLQVRNQGTFAGNIANASPIGDTPPVLLALDAQLQIESPEGALTLPIEQFYTGYKQTRLPAAGVIKSIDIPLDKLDWYRRVYKISKRLEDDISAVLGAIFLKVEQGVIRDARIAFGGMAATPLRVPAAEQALIGETVSLAGIKPAQQAIRDSLTPMSDVRASADYRLQVAVNLLARAVLEYNQPEAVMEVVHYA